jgi:WhiB family redox-sensing transcriptional regulator
LNPPLTSNLGEKLLPIESELPPNNKSGQKWIELSQYELNSDFFCVEVRPLNERIQQLNRTLTNLNVPVLTELPTPEQSGRTIAKLSQATKQSSTPREILTPKLKSAELNSTEPKISVIGGILDTRDSEGKELAECSKPYIDPETFFNPELVEAAKAICESCPIRIQCAAFAIKEGIAEGVWGGLSESERKQISKKRVK